MCHLHDPESKWSCRYQFSSGRHCWSKDLLFWKHHEASSSRFVSHFGRSRQKGQRLWSSTPTVRSHLKESDKVCCCSLWTELSHSEDLILRWCVFATRFNLKNTGANEWFVSHEHKQNFSPLGVSTQSPLALRSGSSRSVSYWIKVYGNSLCKEVTTMFLF